MRLRISWTAVVLAAVLVVGCSTEATETVESVQVAATDGRAAYVGADRTETTSRLIKFTADGDLAWERSVGAISLRGMEAFDGHLWVVEGVPPGTEGTLEPSPDRLLKIDTETGETLGAVEIGAGTEYPDLVIDGNIWLLGVFERRFYVVDPGTMMVEDVIDLAPGLNQTEQTDEVGLPIGIVVDPVRVGDNLYLTGAEPRSVIQYSISRRVVEATTDFPLRALGRAEVHDGRIWTLTTPDAAIDERDWLAHPMDPDTLKLGDPVPFFDSPMGTLVTDEYIFDETDLDEITQIDRATGETIRTIKGQRPRFVLDGHLWLRGLERVKVD